MYCVLWSIWRDERAQGLTEYILGVGLIAVALIAVLWAFREKVAEGFTEATRLIAAAWERMIGGGEVDGT